MSEPLVPPIVPCASFRFRDTAEVLRAMEGEDFLYSRLNNPTVVGVEEELAELIGAERTLLFGSGMAAISTALIALLEERPLLVVQEQVYGATWQLTREILPRLGVEIVTFPSDGWEETFQALAGRDVGVVYAESPTNPGLEITDLRRLAAAAHELGARLLVDNTFASPALQRPLELGADVELHSATKYLGGHHDLLAGVVAGQKDVLELVFKHRTILGGILDPFQAFLLQRGLKTLVLRVERQAATALALAEWLEGQAGVAQVLYPGLSGHRGHEIAREQMEAFGGVLSFVHEGGEAGARRFSESLEVISIAASLGGTETLVTLPSTTTHLRLSPEERAAAGIPPGLVRLAVGLEDPALLQADLARALG
ncbi:MAG: aminotransferase class I/II-fold pyridoxal phosphate-dependent enzyme [Planctomycetes bacterium]|nr:aminotransferase class I/II-fold pyridoxal phosphate-dependent enzyme [Planctomycetota bacterium]